MEIKHYRQSDRQTYICTSRAASLQLKIMSLLQIFLGLYNGVESLTFWSCYFSIRKNERINIWRIRSFSFTQNQIQSWRTFFKFSSFFVQLLNAKRWFLFIICPCVNYQVENEILLTLTNILHLGYRDYPNCSTESWKPI